MHFLLGSFILRPSDLNTALTYVLMDICCPFLIDKYVLPVCCSRCASEF